MKIQCGKALAMFRLAWMRLREASGDAAYESYVRHAARSPRRAGATPLLSREEFYLDALRRRYSSISRCC